MRSGPAGHVRNAILQFLYNKRVTRIGNIRLSLQKRFPDVYKRGGNLTQVHRHLRELKKLGLVDFKTVNGETWFWTTSQGMRYHANFVTTQYHSVLKEFHELSMINDRYKQMQIVEEETREINSSPFSSGNRYTLLEDIARFSDSGLSSPPKRQKKEKFDRSPSSGLNTN